MASADGPEPYVVFLHDTDVVPGPVGALAPLAGRVDLDIPRHPGFGTDLDDQAERWDSVADLAHHHLERIRAIRDPRPVHLVGAGFGGWVALEMASWSPERFASLTLVCPVGVKFSEPTEPEFADVLLLDPTETVALGWADPGACHGLRMPGFPADGDDERDVRAFADRAALARYAWKPFLHDPLLRRWLHVLRMPVLVISGECDRLVRAGNAERLAEEIPGARHVVLAGSGHYPYLETPQLFLGTLLEFIDTVGRPAAEEVEAR